MTTLELLRAIDYPRSRVSLIVIDNASIDGTAKAVRDRYGDEVEVMALQENLGAVARNRVMLTRPEPYIFSFDEDCAPGTPGIIRAVIEFLESNSYFGAVCFRSVNLYSGITEFGNMGTGSRRRLAGGGYEGMFVVGAGMCFRREAIQRTAGYDETMFWGAEEHGLAMELLYHDIPVALDPRFFLIHRHAARAVTPAWAIEVDTRNNIWIAFKYFPIPLALLVATLQTAKRLATAVVKGKPGGAGGVLRGARAGMAGLGDIILRRRPVSVAQLARHNRWFFQMFYSLRS
ncbi:MAG: glycosyltransferase [Chlorobi bacterium]|nr:glycosyltransferase [Chlorobiota bacterium]